MTYVASLQCEFVDEYLLFLVEQTIYHRFRMRMDALQYLKNLKKNQSMHKLQKNMIWLTRSFMNCKCIWSCKRSSTVFNITTVRFIASMRSEIQYKFSLWKLLIITIHAKIFIPQMNRNVSTLRESLMANWARIGSLTSMYLKGSLKFMD